MVSKAAKSNIIKFANAAIVVIGAIRSAGLQANGSRDLLDISVAHTTNVAKYRNNVFQAKDKYRISKVEIVLNNKRAESFHDLVLFIELPYFVERSWVSDHPLIVVGDASRLALSQNGLYAVTGNANSFNVRLEMLPPRSRISFGVLYSTERDEDSVARSNVAPRVTVYSDCGLIRASVNSQLSSVSQAKFIVSPVR